MSDARDMTNRAIERRDQLQPRTNLVYALQPDGSAGTFTVADEWVQVLTLAPAQATGFVRLLAEGGGFYASDEPFYVAGPRTFTIDTGGDVLVQTAQRRELLSRAPVRDFPNNGAAFSELYDDTFNVGFAAGNWAYLNENLQWQTALVNTLPATAFPFGRGATNPNMRGRYYDLEFEMQSTAPAVNAHVLIVSPSPLFGTFSSAVSLDLTALYGTIRVGDDAAAILSGPSYGATAFSQTKLMNRNQWTVVLRPTAAVATSFQGTLKVIRQGA